MKHLLPVLLILLILLPQRGLAIDGVPEQKELKFQILRDGEPFGTHHIKFETEGDLIRADISISMSLSLAFVKLFRYEHENTEIWRDDQLVSIDAETNDNGKKSEVEAEQADGKIRINGTAGSYEAPTDIAASTYWSPQLIMQDKVLNSQKGTLKDIEIAKKEVEQVKVAGDYIPARRYQITLPERVINVWYHTKTGQWVDLKFEIRGSELDYYRLTPLKGNLIPARNGG